MTIFVAVKHLKHIAKAVTSIPFTLSAEPHTVRELIAFCVRTCVASYRARPRTPELSAPLDPETYEGMRRIGKFAFGLLGDDKEIDEEQAIDTATEAFSDGLVRIFLDGAELTELDATVPVREGSSLVFVRLTMLSGRMW